MNDEIRTAMRNEELAAAQAQHIATRPSRGTSVSEDLVCSNAACGYRTVAGYALGSAVWFQHQLASGEIKCEFCGANMKVYESSSSNLPAVTLSNGEKRTNSGLILL